MLCPLLQRALCPVLPAHPGDGRGSLRGDLGEEGAGPELEIGPLDWKWQIWHEAVGCSDPIGKLKQSFLHSQHWQTLGPCGGFGLT